MVGYERPGNGFRIINNSKSISPLRWKYHTKRNSCLIYIDKMMIRYKPPYFISLLSILSLLLFFLLSAAIVVVGGGAAVVVIIVVVTGPCR